MDSSQSAHQGQTMVPSNEEDVDLHFICFVEQNGHLFELDGRKKGPVNHGIIVNGLLEDAAKVIQTQFLDQDPGMFIFIIKPVDSLNFTMMALTMVS
jgi:ubiquitin carboxyl-terminal hydrolase L3